MSVAPQTETQVTSPVLEAVHVRKYFPVRTTSLLGSSKMVQAVDDFSLALYPGRATALVGESGSGKTTVARLFSGMYKPTSGTLRFKGEAVTGRGAVQRAYRRSVQLIFQDPFSSLNPVHDVYYHLSRPLLIHKHARSSGGVDRQIGELLERVSLTPARQYMYKYPHQLSGGQRQRVAIARALAIQPAVLLADEPVSMLDVSIRLDILNLLRRLKDEEHLALLFITHDIASARYFAEDTLVMYAGQMVEGGTSNDVIQQPKHPYTQLLLSAAPDPDSMQALIGQEEATENGWDAELLEVRGEPPSLIDPPSGCRFHPRCPYAMPICREHFPERADMGGGHWTYCHLYDRPSAIPVKSNLAVSAVQEQANESAEDM